MILLIKRQFADRQTLLINTAYALNFLEEYGDRQAQLWTVLYKYHKLPDQLEDLHSHLNSFKASLETDLRHLKLATSKNMQNIQSSIAIQQAYPTALCTHINMIYNKLADLKNQVQQHCMYPHSQVDAVQINAPDYDSDIDGDNQPQTQTN